MRMWFFGLMILGSLMGPVMVPSVATAGTVSCTKDKVLSQYNWVWISYEGRRAQDVDAMVLSYLDKKYGKEGAYRPLVSRCFYGEYLGLVVYGFKVPADRINLVRDIPAGVRGRITIVDSTRR